MNYIIAGLIGILVWQIIGIIVYEASGEKEEMLAWVILFVPVIICNGLGYIYRKLYFVWCKNNLNGYILYCSGLLTIKIIPCMEMEDMLFNYQYMENILKNMFPPMRHKE